MRFNFFWSSIFLLTFLSCKIDSKEEVNQDVQEETVSDNEGNLFQVNPQTSVATWIASSVIRKYDGTIPISRGQLQVDDNQEVSGFFDLKMSDAQLSPYSYKEDELAAINQKIHSQEFLSVDSFPSARFKILQITSIDSAWSPQDKNEFESRFQPEKYSVFMLKNPTHLIEGTLSIKGTVQQLTVPASVKLDLASIVIEARFNIDRTKWSIYELSESQMREKSIAPSLYNTLNVGWYLEAEAVSN